MRTDGRHLCFHGLDWHACGCDKGHDHHDHLYQTTGVQDQK